MAEIDHGRLLVEIMRAREDVQLYETGNTSGARSPAAARRA